MIRIIFKSLISLLVICSKVFAQNMPQAELSMIHANTDTSQSIYLRTYLNLKWDKEFGNYETVVDLEGYNDLSAIINNDRYKVNELYIGYKSNSFVHRLGAQKFSFSETFGVQITDVANPRDYSDFILNDSEDMKLTSWSWSSTWSGANSSIQTFFTPKPTRDILPKKGSYYVPNFVSGVNYSDDLPHYKFLEDSEYGLRTGHLFENGIDLNMLFYRHFNRVPTFALIQNNAVTKYVQVTTIASTLSFALDDTVLRADIVHTFDDIVVEDFNIDRKNNLRAIAGVDYSGFDRLTLGLQGHYQAWMNFYWVSVFGKYEFTDNFFVDVTHFQGINNYDQWLNPKISYRWKDLIASLEADYLYGKLEEQSAISSYSEKNRYLTKITYEL